MLNLETALLVSAVDLPHVAGKRSRGSLCLYPSGDNIGHTRPEDEQAVAEEGMR